MPANLTPQYSKADEEYRQAKTSEEKLACLQKMWALLPKHKGTEKLQAELKQRISRTKKESQQEKKSGKKGPSVRVPRDGAGQVFLIGAPNVGKSQLLAALTNAHPQVAPYPFTTHAPSPGMMPWHDVHVQLVDTPPISADYLEGYLSGMVRGADLCVLVLDLSTDDGPEQAQEVIDRLAQSKSYLVGSLSPDEMGDDDAGFTKTLLAGNKCDSPDAAERLDIVRELFAEQFPILPISATEGTGLETLRDAIYAALEVIRVYTKQPGKPADRQRPFTCPAGSTVVEFAAQVHNDFATNLKTAKVWGSSAFDGQNVKRDHQLQDGDVVELHV
jgi:hypothetical protein